MTWEPLQRSSLLLSIYPSLVFHKIPQPLNYSENGGFLVRPPSSMRRRNATSVPGELHFMEVTIYGLALKRALGDGGKVIV